MDFEEGIPDEHFDMRTGEPCHNDGVSDLWHIVKVSYRTDWATAY